MCFRSDPSWQFFFFPKPNEKKYKFIRSLYAAAVPHSNRARAVQAVPKQGRRQSSQVELCTKYYRKVTKPPSDKYARARPRACVYT